MDLPPHELDADFITEIAVGSVLLVGGIVGNSLTAHFIRKHSDLHAPTFVLIACLACTDVIAIVFRYLTLIYDLQLYSKSKEATNFILICALATLHCSNMHIVILARLRYKLIVFPLQTTGIDFKTIFRSSFLAWVISFIIALCFEVPMSIENSDGEFAIDPRIQNIISVSSGFYLLLSTLIPILWFHIYKVKALRNNHSVPFGSHDVTGKMSVMVTFILAFQVIAIVPLVTTNVCSYLDFELHTLYVFANISHCSLLLNHSINPVLFFYFSKFRRGNIADV